MREKFNIQKLFPGKALIVWHFLFACPKTRFSYSLSNHFVIDVLIIDQFNSFHQSYFSFESILFKHTQRLKKFRENISNQTFQKMDPS